ncbi:MAG: alpha/beta fold hydrolase, partial [Phycisphaerae bacterium]|nr:alpha/beta fold hydrolase [Phycisphaerae bacterium]
MFRATTVCASIWFVCAAAAGPQLEPRVVSFPAYDDYTLSADYYAPKSAREPAPVVILLHDCGADRTCWQPLIAPLYQAGFAVLALDLRGHGHSATSETQSRVERQDSTLFEDMFYDLRGAYDWLAKQPDVDRARLALVGAGAGSGVALHYSREDLSVD